MKNGRVSKVQGNLATVLGIRILGKASDEGTLELLHRCRGKLTAYDKALTVMNEQNFSGGRVILCHSNNEERSQYLISLIQSKYPNCDIELLPTGGLCSYYAEDNGVLIAFECN